MVAGGISYYGLSDLMVLKGTMNNFTYPQALNFFKESYDLFKKKMKIYTLSKMGHHATPQKAQKNC